MRGYMLPGTSLGCISANPKLSPSKDMESTFMPQFTPRPPAIPMYLYFRVVNVNVPPLNE